MSTPSSIPTHPAFPARVNERQFLELIFTILSQINKGSQVEEILENIFRSLDGLLPYDRIGFSLIDAKAYTATAIWQRARYEHISLGVGYTASLRGSSLERILLTGQPRIIPDLAAYAAAHPQSASTQLIIAEGLRSSLTCPITRGDKPIGFLYFSSLTVNAYQPQHLEAFRWVAEPIALALDKAQLYQRLVQLNEEKNLFLGVAAHDLRSPIAQLQTTGQLLQLDSLRDTDRKELAGIIVGRCQGMLTLLHDLLDLSAIEAGRLPLRLETLQLAPFCQSLLHGLQPLARAKQITLQFSSPEPLQASVDPARLSQAIDNLLTSAIKVAPRLSTVTLGLSKSHLGIQLMVTDQGPGIDASQIKRLFQPFAPGSRGHEDLGLELAIVKKIIDAHGGTIEVSSQPPQGASFRLTLPPALSR